MYAHTVTLRSEVELNGKDIAADMKAADELRNQQSVRQCSSVLFSGWPLLALPGYYLINPCPKNSPLCCNWF
jgi:hypothetical protein